MTTLSIDSLIEESLKTESVEDIHALCSNVARSLEFDYFLYGAQFPTSFIRPEYVIISGFPSDWWEHYNTQGYMAVDPTVAHCATRVVPLPWDRIDAAKINPALPARRVDQFMSEAWEHRLKPGASFPVHGGQGQAAIFSLVSNTDDKQAREHVLRNLAYGQLLSSHVHEAVQHIVVNNSTAISKVQLTDRERECLTWAAEGKTAWETGQILNISERTVIFHLQNAAEKLQVSNRPQAVARAVSQISIAPLSPAYSAYTKLLREPWIELSTMAVLSCLGNGGSGLCPRGSAPLEQGCSSSNGYSEATLSAPRHESETREPRLCVGRYRLLFDTPEAPAGAYLGSAWRGAFGHALKRTACVTGIKDCKTCSLFRTCSYPYIFETPPPEGSAKMRLYPAAPHPFVFDVPDRGVYRGPGLSVYIGVTLVGRANALLPLVVLAMRHAGHEGVGPGRQRFTLLGVEQEDERGAWATVFSEGGALEPLPARPLAWPPLPSRVRLRVETPLRIKRGNAVLRADGFSFADLFGSLLRRISMLSYFHTSCRLETDFRGLTRSACTVPVLEHALQWHDLARFSSRQGRHMQLGGLVGEVEFPVDGLEPYWPYLWIGQFVHTGHAASMGLGRYQILDAASLPRAT